MSRGIASSADLAMVPFTITEHEAMYIDRLIVAGQASEKFPLDPETVISPEGCRAMDDAIANKTAKLKITPRALTETKANV